LNEVATHTVAGRGHIHHVTTAHHQIFGASWSSFGALLIVVGALLLIWDALSGPAGISAVTFGGTVPDPKRRLAAAVELAGSALVLLGSAILVAVAGVSILAVVVVLSSTALILYGAMAYFLRTHMTLIAKEGETPPGQSWRWRLMHPRWRPPPD
jgi:hypothetical protein